MLRINDLSVQYTKGRQTLTACDHVSLLVPEGGTTGLVGESGSGKSSLARALVGLAPVTSGSITLGGEDWTSARSRNSKRYRRLVQIVFQDPHSSLNPRMTIGNILSDALAARGLPASARPRECRRLVDILGLSTDSLSRYPHELSGGQSQRAAIGRALAIRPKVLILDEVTSALDVSVQARILNLLNQLQRELDLTVLFISHDLSVVAMMSDLVGVMYAGRVVERAPSDAIFSAPRHPYTKALLASIPTFSTAPVAVIRGEGPDPRRSVAGCSFHTRCPVGPMFHPERSICVDADPAVNAERKENQAACHFAPAAAHAPVRDESVTP